MKRNLEVLLAALAICSTAAAQTFRQGAYTAEQAARGERVYTAKCAGCHGESLQGIEMAPALAGPIFGNTWNRQPLLSLASRIQITMPPAMPRSLASDEVNSVVSYILKANDVPPGGVALSLPVGSRTTARGGANTSWPTYGADLASSRYSPLDQINKDNFGQLQVAWRLKTNNLGPTPDRLYSATPLVVDGVLYTTAGTARSVVALNPGTGQMLWMYQLDEGERGQNAPRRGAGRGLSYWSSPDGADRRIVFVTPGYQMIALNAKTGRPIESFGKLGIVDLKEDNDQKLDPVRSNIGLNATPLVIGDLIVVGSAHAAAGNPLSSPDAIGYVRAYDIKTGKRAWIFHTLPKKGEVGYETWLEGSAEKNGNLGAWAQFSADPELGLVYIPTEMPAADYYGVNRPGSHLFSESLVALDIKTGKRRWHYQTIHHGLWDWDLPCAPVLFDMVKDGRKIKALAQPAKSAFLFVLNRETGEPIWPIVERDVPQSDVPGEKTSPTQPFPTWPPPFDRQGVSIDDLIDFTPELRKAAVELVSKYKIGPIFTPPALARPGGPLGTLMLPMDVGGANWPGGSLDPENNRLYIHSHTTVYSLRNVPAELATPGPANTAGTLQPASARPAGGPRGPGGPFGPGGPGPRFFLGPTVQDLPLIKPPWDRITAYDLNTGNILWQKTHSSTPDDIKNHPVLKGLNLPRLGQPGRTFVGVLTTKTLVIAGEGGVHSNAKGEQIALLRAYDKATGEDIAAEVKLPGKQTGSPMTYLHQGKQYIVLAVTTTGDDGGGELIAFALP